MLMQRVGREAAEVYLETGEFGIVYFGNVRSKSRIKAKNITLKPFPKP